jgi:hypothetical protein
MKIIVFSDATSGRDDDYNEWYDSTHINDVLAIPGVTGAQRFRLGSVDGGPPAPSQKYLAIYEFEGDPASFLKELGVRAGDGRMVMTDAIDPTTSVMGFYEQI